ncbi:hypothetical protein ElyMa_004630500 [Elysia marginata]|uniref:Uncharacterized protein n=1 Tax=Elysia marginata TaxID=1093978 RepID=A0AAV4I012_9GAST|nr:hypothetical protein ElyMa_004630500 [Elysia marginata]
MEDERRGAIIPSTQTRVTWRGATLRPSTGQEMDTKVSKLWTLAVWLDSMMIGGSEVAREHFPIPSLYGTVQCHHGAEQ